MSRSALHHFLVFPCGAVPPVVEISSTSSSIWLIMKTKSRLPSMKQGLALVGLEPVKMINDARVDVVDVVRGQT